MTFSASRSRRPRARTRFAARTRWRTSTSRTGPTCTNNSRTPSSQDCRSVRRRSRVRSTSSIDSWARKQLRSRAPTARRLATLAGLGKQFDALNDSIGAQTNSSTAVVDGSFAIDKATPVETSKVKELGRNALSGLAAGLGIGLALVVILAVTSNRVWRRDDVAE